MISKGEASFWVPTNVFLTSNLPLLFNHLDLGWTGLVSMGAMFFLPFLGTGSTGHSITVDSFCRVHAIYNTFNKNIASFIGNPSGAKIPIRLTYQLKSFRSFREEIFLNQSWMGKSLLQISLRKLQSMVEEEKVGPVGPRGPTFNLCFTSDGGLGVGISLK